MPVLKNMLLNTVGLIHAECGVHPEEVMAYIHYPPSVYQLHVHFSYPYAQQTHRSGHCSLSASLRTVRFLQACC